MKQGGRTNLQLELGLSRVLILLPGAFGYRKMQAGAEPDEPDELPESEPDELPESEPDEPADSDEPPPSVAGAAPLPCLSFAALEPAGAAAARVLLDPPRSFFAQPDPLKWTVGTANCLRIVPASPHDGQKCGPGSLIPWRMSAR